MGTVHNFAGLWTTRFMLGLAEGADFDSPQAHLATADVHHSLISIGGLFPGLNFVLTTWYNRNELNLVVSLFFAGSTLAGAFGGADQRYDLIWSCIP